LSAQDANIQGIFSTAEKAMKWLWPTVPPAYVFAEDQIGLWQENILKVAYGDETYAAEQDAINMSALIRAFGKPLLVALVLDVLGRKAKELIKLTATTLPAGEVDRLCTGITALRDRAASTAGNGNATYMQGLLAVLAQATSRFRSGKASSALDRYAPLTVLPVGQMQTSPTFESDGVRELALSLGLIGCGVSDRGWSVQADAGAPLSHGVIRVSDGSRERAFFLAATHATEVELTRSGAVTGSSLEAVMIRCDVAPDPPTRAPTAPVGRTGAGAGREVSIRSLLHDATTLDDLERSFRLEVGLS
jgi:hypothetical protein